MARKSTWLLLPTIFVGVVFSNAVEENVQDGDVKPQMETILGNYTSSYTPMRTFDRRRRNRGVVLFGLDRAPYETSHQLKDIILDLFKEQMGLDVQSHEIERVKRFGNLQSPHSQIAIRLSTFKRKGQLLSSGKSLKGSGLSLADDFPKDVVDTRRKLMGPMMYYRKHGRHAIIRWDKLYVEGVPVEKYDGKYIRYNKYRERNPPILDKHETVKAECIAAANTYQDPYYLSTLNPLNLNNKGKNQESLYPPNQVNIGKNHESLYPLNQVNIGKNQESLYHSAEVNQENPYPPEEVDQENQYHSEVNPENQHHTEVNQENEQHSEVNQENQHHTEVNQENQHYTEVNQENQHQSEVNQENQHQSEVNQDIKEHDRRVKRDLFDDVHRVIDEQQKERRRGKPMTELDKLYEFNRQELLREQEELDKDPYRTTPPPPTPPSYKHKNDHDDECW